MKKTLILALGLGLALTGTAWANTLSVVAGGFAGTNYHLEVVSDNSSAAWVQDVTPTNEIVYRASVLVALPQVTTEPSAPFRQNIFNAVGPNPNPGLFNCPASAAAQVDTIRLFQGYTFFGGIGRSWLQLNGFGIGCGAFSSGAVFFIHQEDTNGNDVVNACFFTEAGTPGVNGRIGLYVGDDDEACPSTSSGMYRETTANNFLMRVNLVRLGTPQTNFFNVGEEFTYGFDEFASFRTLIP